MTIYRILNRLAGRHGASIAGRSSPHPEPALWRKKNFKILKIISFLNNSHVKNSFEICILLSKIKKIKQDNKRRKKLPYPFAITKCNF